MNMRLSQPVSHALIVALLAGAVSTHVAAEEIGTESDLICGGVAESPAGDDSLLWGMENGIAAYSFSTTACNVGTRDELWEQLSSQHPVIAQNIYRILNGRFEQIGISWVKHGFSVINEQFCTPGGPPCSSAALNLLAPNCSDTYSSFLNGNFGLGPRSEVNATTGVLVWPHTQPNGPGSLLDRGRIEVREVDLDPANNPGAIYILEGQYIAPRDASAGNGANNVSHRLVTFDAQRRIIFSEATIVTEPAINAWAVADSSVLLSTIDLGSGERYVVGAKVTDNGDGTWRYEYAEYNQNSDRAMGSFTIPVPNDVTIVNLDFHDIAYHSGEIYETGAWTTSRSFDSLTWRSVTFKTNPNANALRWGSVYNFRFDADQPPNDVAVTSATIGFFKPGTPDSATTAVPAPKVPFADCNGNTVNDFDEPEDAHVMCISGTSQAVPWSWQITFAGGVIYRDESVGPLTVGAGPSEFRDAFVASINDPSNGCETITASPMTDDACFVVTVPVARFTESFQFGVGPENGAVTCDLPGSASVCSSELSGDGPCCSFNPNLILVDDPTPPVPTVSTWGLAVMATLFVTACTVVLKRRRERPEVRIG